jgi:predicted ATPase
MAMFVGVLGPLVVEHEGRPVDVTGGRARVLLVHLALQAGRVVPTEVLARAIWPEADAGERANTLQTLVSRLRRRLPAECEISTGAGGYRLVLPPGAVDALNFELLVADGRRLLRQGDAAGALERLREGLGLWRGRAIVDAADTPYAQAVAARLEELRLSATEDRVRTELELGADAELLIPELEELTTAHPLRERMRALLITALTGAGRTAEALAAYDSYRTVLAERLGADPGAEARQAHLLALRGTPSAPPRPVARGNLRPSRTSLVGRAEAEAAVRRQLATGRLVTLVGPGGVGKTRLAGVVAQDVAGDCPGGAWLIDLAAVTEPRDAVPAVLGVLRIRDGQAPDIRSDDAALGRLANALGAGESLLLLDNCEHLIGTVAWLADELLSRCPRLRILATSREPLGVPGELLAPVPPLPVPASGVGLAEALDSPAVSLFVERARAVRPDFGADEANVAVIAEICRRLDGLPLAIELAAARIRSLPVEEVARRLGDRFNLLTGGSRVALPRHQTLRAVMAWSWALLDEGERQLARRLAVFAGPVGVAGAEAVGVGGEVSRESVLGLLGALVDKSLLQLLDGVEPRYRMLETLREYALERLAESDGVAAAREAHARHFLGVARAAAPHLTAAGQLPWLQRLRQERSNLLAALRFAQDSGDEPTTVGLTSALAYFWTVEGSHAEAAGWLGAAVGGGDAAVRSSERLTVLGAHLFNVVLSGGQARPAIDPAAVRGWLDEVDWAAQRSFAALIAPTVALLVDDPGWGIEAIDRSSAAADMWTRGMLDLLRAFLQGNAGDMAATRTSLVSAVEAFRSSGDRWGLAMGYTALAEADAMLGDFAAAADVLTEAIRLLREFDPDDHAVLQRSSLAAARIQLGDVDRARAELAELVSPHTAATSGRFRVFARIQLGNLARYDGDRAEAARQYAAARSDLDAMVASAPLAGALLDTAEAHLALDDGDTSAARRLLATAFGTAAAVPDMPITAAVAVAVARQVTATGDPLAGGEVLGAAQVLRGAPDAANPDVARTGGTIRELAGNDGYATAYERGARLPRVAALELVRARLHPS